MPDFDFMNPYNFVPLEPMQAGKRQKPALHHDVDAGLNHGRLVCHVYALSPIFVPDYSRLEEVHLPPLEMRNGPPKRREPHKIFEHFFSRPDGTPVIPASALKGTIRAVAEALANGCLSVFGGTYGNRTLALPSPTKPGEGSVAACTDNELLCPTCRLFGMPMTSTGADSDLFFKGKVAFSDARLVGAPKYMDLLLLTELSSPKPEQSDIYLEGGVVRGRKFYYHRDGLDVVKGSDNEAEKARQWRGNSSQIPHSSRDGLHRKVSVRPLAPGSTFEFTVDFHHLSGTELSLLIMALELYPRILMQGNEPKRDEGGAILLRKDERGKIRRGVYHKIGYGRPAGLGTAAVVIQHWRDLQPRDRYRNAGGGFTEINGIALRKLVAKFKKQFLQQAAATHVRDLFKILEYPNGIPEIRYPTLQEFNDYELPQPGHEPGRR